MFDASARSCVSRRSLLTGLATIPTLLVSAGSTSGAQTAAGSDVVKEVQAALKNASGTKLVMLGTGAGPNPTAPGRTRLMTSHVMVSNTNAYVLDCGLGVTNQFAKTGVPFTSVRSIFVTHHHPDHNIEYGPSFCSAGCKGCPVRCACSVRLRSSR